MSISLVPRVGLPARRRPRVVPRSVPRLVPGSGPGRSGSGELARRLVVGGALVEALALALLASLRCVGSLDLDMMMLLPAAACAGAAAMSLGLTLDCLRALQATRVSRGP